MSQAVTFVSMLFKLARITIISRDDHAQCPSVFSSFTKVVVYYLAMFKVNAVAKSSSKPIPLHPSNPCMFLIGKLMGYMLKYYGNSNIFLVCVISTR